MSPRLQKLSQKQWEAALMAVHKAWEKADGPQTLLKPPRGLKHLQGSDWEEICQCLWTLQYQRAHSPLH